MEKRLFIAATEKRSGKTFIALGLMNALLGLVPRVGYIKPIGQHYRVKQKIDEDAHLMKGILDLPDAPDDMSPVTIESARGDKDVLYRRIFDAYKRVSSQKDIVIIEGTDYTSTVSALEFDINAELAKDLGAVVLLVAKGFEKSIDEIVSSVTECITSFRETGCRVLGTIINRYVSPNVKQDTQKIKAALEKEKIPLFGVVSHEPILSGPRLREVMKKLDAKIIYRGDDLSKVVTDVRVLAMTPENALRHIKDKDGYLLITPGDRMDIILTVLSAQKSTHYPRFSGVILTGGLLPGENVNILIEGMTNTDLTILSVKDDTYSTALKVNRVRGELTKDDPEKVSLARRIVERHVDFNEIHMRLGSVDTITTTPRMFQYSLLEMAKSNKRRIVLPEGSEKRILQAASEVLQREVCDVFLIGERDEILDISRSIGADVSKATILHPSQSDPDTFADYARTFYELRKHKGVTREMAWDIMLDPVHFATMMVYKAEADGFVSGTTHSTAETLLPVLRIIRAKKNISLASSIFFMCMPDRVLVYGDCALVENPNAVELADIAITSAETAQAFGVEPYVAMLSYSTGESGRGKDVDKVKEATRIVKQKRPNVPVEGPIQYDAAASEEVAKVKLGASKVAGRATVYIFPDLDAGNTAYKAVQRSAKIPAIGPVVQGLNKPANDLSRGADVTDIIYTIAITAIQAQQN